MRGSRARRASHATRLPSQRDPFGATKEVHDRLRAAARNGAGVVVYSSDPFVVNKLRSFEVREWTVMEGSLGVKVNFSDQSLEIA